LLRSTNAAAVADAPDAAAFPEQPWNLRQAYTATRILSRRFRAYIMDAARA